jgi:hypothetical protein
MIKTYNNWAFEGDSMSEHRFNIKIIVFLTAIIMIIPLNILPMDVEAPGPGDLNSTIQEIISKVTESSCEKYITDLQNFGTRYAYTSQCNLSAQYIFDEFSNYSALSVESDYFRYNGYVVRNIIATLPGLDESDDTVYVVGGHYDSTSNDRWNNAPGADDDASGTAVALEGARILSQYKFNSTIVFAAWTVEEMGLIGSQRWVANQARAATNIGAYLNFDMIGYDPDNKMGLDIGYNDDSIWLANEMVNINNDFTIGLNITTGSGGDRSDHASFWQWGYTAVECIESEFNTPYYHTVNDTVDKLNMEFDKKVTQLGLATLAKLAGVLPPARGALFLDRVAYLPTDTVNVKLYDTDLNLDPAFVDFAIVEMTSTTESQTELLPLWETGINTSIFIGPMDITTGVPVLDGVLQVTEGDTIYVRYQDSSPAVTITKTALVDGIPPVISNVLSLTGVSEATISWDTDEPSDSIVFYGISPSLGLEISDSDMVTSHSIDLHGLEPSLTYYFDVQSVDHAGNFARDDNSGEHYNFTTLLGITGIGESGYVGYVKQSAPSSNYFSGPDIYVGHGAQGNYYGAAQFRDLWFPSTATMTNATVKVCGRRWVYAGSAGSWNLKMLESAIDSDWTNHGYTEISGATVDEVISPAMNDGDLSSRTWNYFYYDPSQYASLKTHLANTMVSYRVDGPSSGYHMFLWETGNNDDGLGMIYAPKITITYDPSGDTVGPTSSDLDVSPDPTAGISQVTLTGVISYGTSGGSPIVLAKYYDPVSNSWIRMLPEDGLYDSPLEGVLGYIDITSWPDGIHTIWVRGLDDSGNWGDAVSVTFTKKPTYDIPLAYGWNLISLPLNQTETTLSSVFSSIDGFYDAVQWFDTTDTNDPWKHNHNQKMDSLNDLFDVDHTKGIWIHITEPSGVIFECSGTTNTQNVPIDLKKGWNHVGYPSLVKKERSDGLNNLLFGTDINVIWTFESQTGQWMEIGEFDEFVVGRGYWVHSKVDTTWFVPN